MSYCIQICSSEISEWLVASMACCAVRPPSAGPRFFSTSSSRKRSNSSSKYALSRGAMVASPARTKRRSSNEFLSAGLSVTS